MTRQKVSQLASGVSVSHAKGGGRAATVVCVFESV